MLKLPIICLVASSLLTGCIVGKFHQNPDIRGTIKNIDGKNPVPDAQIYLKYNPRVTAITDKNGLFHLSATSKWQLFPGLLYSTPSSYESIIQKEGFYSEITPLSGYKSETIFLTPRR